MAKLGGGGSRFAQARGNETNPGPGAYDLKATLRAGRPNRKALMMSSAPRFGAGGATAAAADAYENPGPGAYDYEMPFGNLLKPTYNVAIAEQCRELVF